MASESKENLCAGAAYKRNHWEREGAGWNSSGAGCGIEFGSIEYYHRRMATTEKPSIVLTPETVAAIKARVQRSIDDTRPNLTSRQMRERLDALYARKQTPEK